ncbi:hypothetical protein THUN1379_09630 [Paludibacterium sp. THUN1379]|uniref:calcium-binding protein n=1 Tax=Paludibacterium sp. THUN1379 TaxID=3112107 RepID=UPI0030895516|nr:hypothetical protein THUN1379_09630 [Paludibacterium sp. THUN1379]
MSDNAFHDTPAVEHALRIYNQLNSETPTPEPDAQQTASAIPPSAASQDMEGSPADDHLCGGPGADRLDGADGDDQLCGAAGNDQLRGGPGDDRLRGGAGRDLLYGGPGNDVLEGEQGFDYLSGGDGDDVLLGGAGHDILDGGRGNDLLSGGEGRDTFRWQWDELGGIDHLRDFTPGEDCLGIDPDPEGTPLRLVLQHDSEGSQLQLLNLQGERLQTIVFDHLDLSQAGNLSDQVILAHLLEQEDLPPYA